MNCFLFRELSEAELSEVMTVFGSPVNAARGDDIYRVGSLGIILSGNAKVCRTGDTGSETVIRSMAEGEVFGAAGLFGEWKEGKSRIVATAECKVLYATECDMRRLFEKHPQVAVNYVTFLSDRIRFLNRRIDAFSAGSAVQKLYEYLVSQAKDGEVDLGYGMAELSRRLKMGRSSIYRSIETLEQGGLIRRNKNTFILM